MLGEFFHCLKSHGIAVTPREHLDLISALKQQVVFADSDGFYRLARTILVKDESQYDNYDRAFASFFDGINNADISLEAMIPEEWLQQTMQRLLDEEKIAQAPEMSDLQSLLDSLKERLAEQQAKHQGGNKWIGTAGTSPYGHGGYNPAGIRIGGQGGQKRAVKVWEKRQYRNLDGDQQLGTRQLQVALRGLRKFARVGASEELDLNNTIAATAKNAGLLDIKMTPERHNAIKVLIFFDVGGSMDGYVRQCERLFSAVRNEFKQLNYFYFHNFVYEHLWQDNQRRQQSLIHTQTILNTYSKDYRLFIIGDASMSPWEIVSRGGSIEHFNEEAGETWLRRIVQHFDKTVWLNPVSEPHWDFTQSIALTQQLMDDRMFPLTVKGLENAITLLKK